MLHIVCIWVQTHLTILQHWSVSKPSWNVCFRIKKLLCKTACQKHMHTNVKALNHCKSHDREASTLNDCLGLKIHRGWWGEGQKTTDSKSTSSAKSSRNSCFYQASQVQSKIPSSQGASPWLQNIKMITKQEVKSVQTTVKIRIHFQLFQ